LGRGNQKKRSGVVNEPLYADHLNIYHYQEKLEDLWKKVVDKGFDTTLSKELLLGGVFSVMVRSES